MMSRGVLLGSDLGQILSAKGPDGVEGKSSGALGLWGRGGRRLKHEEGEGTVKTV